MWTFLLLFADMCDIVSSSSDTTITRPSHSLSGLFAQFCRNLRLQLRLLLHSLSTTPHSPKLDFLSMTQRSELKCHLCVFVMLSRSSTTLPKPGGRLSCTAEFQEAPTLFESSTCTRTCIMGRNASSSSWSGQYSSSHTSVFWRKVTTKRWVFLLRYGALFSESR